MSVNPIICRMNTNNLHILKIYHRENYPIPTNKEERGKIPSDMVYLHHPMFYVNTCNILAFATLRSVAFI